MFIVMSNGKRIASRGVVQLNGSEIEVTCGVSISGNLAIGPGNTLSIGDNVNTEYSCVTISYDSDTATYTNDIGTTGNAAGSILYIGDTNENTFAQIQYTLTNAIVVGSGGIVFEYYNGNSWTSFSVMNSLDGYNNTTRVFTGSEYIVYNIHLSNTITEWVSYTINSVNAKWIRIVIESPITECFSISDIVLGGSRGVIRDDGSIIFFGVSRPKNQIAFENVYPRNSNEADIMISENITLVDFGYIFQEYADKSIYFTWSIPLDADTSCPLELILDGYGLASCNGNGDDDIDIDMYVTGISGGNIYGVNVTEQNVGQIMSLGSYYRETNYRPATPIYVDISRFDSGDIIYLRIRRNASVTNTIDTYNGDYVMLHLIIRYTKWSYGGMMT